MDIDIDGTGEVDIGGPDGSDYEVADDSDDGGQADTQERRMAPVSVLTRPGLLAGHLRLHSSSVIFINENENGEKRENNEFIN